MDLVRPLRLFLDTNHLLNLVHLRQDRTLLGVQNEPRIHAYETIDEWLRTGRCVPVFCETLAYEWIRQRSPEGPARLAGIFDSSPGRLRIFADSLVFIVEAMSECQRIAPEIGFPDFEIVRELGPDSDIHRWFNDHWPRKEDRPFTMRRLVGAGRTDTVAFVVESVAEQARQQDLWKVALDSEAYRLRQTREAQQKLGASAAVLSQLRRDWPRRALLLDQVIHSMNPGVDAERVLSQIRFDRCPAISLQVDAYWAYAKATREPQDHDFVDLTMFAVLPYVQVALIEKRMHEFVRQVRRKEYANRVFRDPVAMVESLSGRI